MPATNYVWDGDQYLIETDEFNTTQAVFTNEPDEYTNLISQRRDRVPHFAHFDALGSTRELSDYSEVVADEWSYDGWGNVVSHTGTTEFVFQFVGMFGYVYDAENASFYIFHRIYEPGNARWLSEDLMRSDSYNLYLYCVNNPVDHVDPAGESRRSLLSIQPRDITCKACGSGGLTWDVKPTTVLVVPRGQPDPPSEVAIIQRVCVSYNITLCACEKGKCVAKGELPFPPTGDTSSLRWNCCRYESLGTARTKFGALGSKYKVSDTWSQTLTNPDVKPRCSWAGVLRIRADVRAFDNDRARISNKILTWDPPSQVRPYKCGELGLQVGFHTRTQPEWWNNSSLIYERGQSWMLMDFNCCPGDSQTLTYRSTSMGRSKQVMCSIPNVNEDPC